MPGLQVRPESLTLYNWDHFHQDSSSIIQKTPPYKFLHTFQRVAPPKVDLEAELPCHSSTTEEVSMEICSSSFGTKELLSVATTTIISWKKRHDITSEDKRVLTIFFPKLSGMKRLKTWFFADLHNWRKTGGCCASRRHVACAPVTILRHSTSAHGIQKNKYENTHGLWDVCGNIYTQSRIARQPNFHQLLPLALGLSSATLDWFSRCDTTLKKPAVVWATKIGHLTYPVDSLLTAAKQAIVL